MANLYRVKELKKILKTFDDNQLICEREFFNHVGVRIPYSGECYCDHEEED